ncbi:MAG: fused MFS/spermidine synthase, partial [Holophagales bacterium]|nr:fused MFS/spermidine synthase [Holophagales bacterium]
MGYALIPWKLEEKSTIAILAGGLLVCCMVCHGEIHRSRPHPDKLTGFYLAISAGGATGGLFVALLAPHLFAEGDELPLGLAFLGALILAILRRDPESRFHRARWRPDWLLAIAAVLVFTFLVVYRMDAVRKSSRALARNFYGHVRVADRVSGTFNVRGMFHGATNHGEQILPPALSKVGRSGDRFRFYEINPLVIDLARSEFTYLAQCKAEVSVVLGDARLSLEREPPQRFDILVVDAFSGDSIPVHLLTREAFALYQRHLAPGGVLAVHCSNRFLNLPPVVALAAKSRGLEARVVHSPGKPDML